MNIFDNVVFGLWTADESLITDFLPKILDVKHNWVIAGDLLFYQLLLFFHNFRFAYQYVLRRSANEQF